MRLFITSAGRRGYIVDYFEKELDGIGEVFVGNSNPYATSLYHGAKYVITPPVYDSAYVDFLQDFCKKYGITDILSLFDMDVTILSGYKNLFRNLGVNILVSDLEIVDICNDKWKTYLFCVEHQIKTPRTYINMQLLMQDIDEHKLSFPIIIKPRFGMGSISIFEAASKEELYVLAEVCRRGIKNSYIWNVDNDSSLIFQEKLSGQEYGIDIINDLTGKNCANVIRKKISMRSGETDVAMIVDDEKYYEFSKQLSLFTRHILNLDIDVIEMNDEIYLLEMNARFGGGYPFSYLAGVNLPRAIIKWRKGEALTDELNINAYGEVFLKDICFVKQTEDNRMMFK